MNVFKYSALTLLVAFSACKKQPQITWVSSTNDNVWVEKTYNPSEESSATSLSITIDTQNQEQEVTGLADVSMN